MRLSISTALCLALLSAGAPLAAQSSASRTAEGQPEAAGIVRTATPGPAIAAMFEGVIDHHPASSGTRTITMKEAVMGYLAPQRMTVRWYDEGNFIFRNPGERDWQISDIEGNTASYEAPAATAAAQALPAGVTAREESARGDIAFCLGRDLYYADTEGNIIEVAVSDDPSMSFGQTVSRNEFAINGGIFWSPSGDRLAFYSKDESHVTDFPLLDISTRTGTLENIKYPMNGMDSERVGLGIYDLETGETVWAAVTDFGQDRYLTNISWTPDEEYIYIQVVDRTQHHVRLNMYDVADGSFVRTVLTEDNEAWVEPYAPLHFFGDKGHFIYSSDNRDGYKSLYFCDDGGGVRRITDVAADVEFVSEDGRYIYYTSSEISPAELHLYRISVKEHRSGALSKVKFGKPERLTPERGWHNVQLSPDCSHFLDEYSDFNTPRILNLRTADGTLVRRLFEAGDPNADYRCGEIVFGKISSADGQYENHYRLLLPPDFDPSEKYPLLLYVYGGPHSQMVHDSWLGYVRYWELLMAQKGYIVYVQDNRGTPYHGADYEKAINRRCGQVEMEDQMEGIRKLLDKPFVDSGRVGVHGWSYGGYMTISLMTHYPDVFKVGVAGGPVIDWKWYEIMYGERYMDTPALNPEGFEQTSLLGRVDSLKGKLLICQGAIDNTVVWEHSLSFVQQCIEHGVQLDYFPYPRSEHNVMGIWRIHLMDKVTDYFDTWL